MSRHPTNISAFFKGVVLRLTRTYKAVRTKSPLCNSAALLPIGFNEPPCSKLQDICYQTSPPFMGGDKGDGE